MILAKIWKHKKNIILINTWSAVICLALEHHHTSDRATELVGVLLQHPKSKMVTAKPRDAVSSSQRLFWPQRKGEKETKERKWKRGIWIWRVCAGKKEVVRQARSRERSWAAPVPATEAALMHDELLTYGWRLSQVADTSESPYFRGFTAVFLRQGLNEEKEAVLWTRSGKAVVRRNPESWHVHIKIDTTFYICGWLDN